MTCYFQGTHAAPSPPTSAPIISVAPHVWCDSARFSLSRSTAWTCRGQPTTKQSAPSGMQEAASGWHFWETGFHLERCQTLVDPRTSGPSQGNNRQTRRARRARRPRPLWWRAQRVVCPRALRQLSAMAMTLWVICWNMSVFHRTSCRIFPHCVSSLCVQLERANETNQVLSKLKKDSLQDGKHTMGVSNLFSDSRTIRNKKRLRKYTSLHTVGRMHTLFHGFLHCSPPSLSFNYVTDPADHPHSSLYLRWRCGARDTEPQHRAATQLWHSWQVCLLWQRFLPSLTSTTRSTRTIFMPILSLSTWPFFGNAMLCQINHR